MTPQPPKRSWTHGRLGAVLLLIVAVVAACIVDNANQHTASPPPAGYSNTR